MELAIIGLGRMGANMAERLVAGGHRVIGYARHAEAVQAVEKKGVVGASSYQDLVSRLTSPRVIWIMIPVGNPVDETLRTLTPMLAPGDIIVDGGNSYYKDTIRRAAELREKKINYVDSGTSGGIWGLKEGYSLMIGGEKEAVEPLRPIFETLAPAPDKGWGHVGPSGAGHFVKMVHNGIEYGLMQAYAEGFALMKGKAEFSLDLHQVSEIWRFGSVVRSWLLDLAAEALAEDQGLEDIAPFVFDSGEGRWTAMESIEQGQTAPVITLSLMQRFRSRDQVDFADRILAVLRQKFGGHEIKKKA
ncbi:MAG: decarboxylating 6-phosphogluconate dehydrogenase [Candidatus Aminicenantes bacterium]|nr:decarboxylating 6-phosphogluconate dehydrogenase [Candidatus Aminicenantes bacterium]TFG54547.1 MAG: decarboxylating 6-phosphogluconate dehydrogenase [Candidatus Aminicenantes bacterium]